MQMIEEAKFYKMIEVTIYNRQMQIVDGRVNSLQKVDVDDVPQQEDVVAEQEET